MSQSIDLDKLKQRTEAVSKSWKKKITHLSNAVSRNGIDGVQYWLKSQHQVEELEDALSDLKQAALQADFSFLQVHTTLSSFILPKEDTDHAEWYLTANNLIESFYKKLTSENSVDLILLKRIVKELQFISKADDFHLRYQLTELQQEVTNLYQQLQDTLSELKKIEKDKLQISIEKEKTKQAELETKKADTLAKKAMLESMKMKEKRIAIMEEKRRQVANKEASIERQKVLDKEEDARAKQEEINRQAKLQESYLELQLEEKIASWDLSTLIAKAQLKLEGELSAEDKSALGHFMLKVQKLD